MFQKQRFCARIAFVFAVTFAVLAGFGRGAEAANDRPTNWRLLTVPVSSQTSTLFANPGVRIVAQYDSFTLVEARGPVVRQLLAAGAEFRDDMHRVRIGNHSFDPAVATEYLRAKAGEEPRMAARGGTGMVVVHFIGPLKPEWLDAILRTGAELVSYMPQNAQLVAGDSGALAALTKLVEQERYVRAVVPYSPLFKLRTGVAKSGVAEVVISTAAGKPGDSARAEIRRLATAKWDEVRVGGTIQQRIAVNASRITELAELGGVVAIEPFDEPKLLDERSAMIVANQLDASFQPVLGTGYRQFLLNKGFTGISPVIVDITDEGVDKGVVPPPAGSHPGFYRNGNPAAPSRIVYAQEATALDANARDCGGHGTNVAGIIAGFNIIAANPMHEDTQGFNYGLGVQPFGQIGATKIFNCNGSFDVTTSISALHSNAYQNGARISNNSWGAAVGGAYNAQAREFDVLVRDAQSATAGNQQFAEVVAAGNSGAGTNTIASPGTAKNVITVGASEGARAIGATDGCGVTDMGASSARDIINFSSRGPTDDGRIKPDVVAPGTHITGEQPQTGAEYNGSGTCNPQFPVGSTLYSLVSGTSQATPHASGFASLIHTWYRANFGNNTTYPSPAMTKALMINTATDLAGGDAGNGTVIAPIPNFNQGWGRINLGNLLDGTGRSLLDQTSFFTASGQSKNLFYTIDDSTKPLRVTLVWTDAPGPISGNAFVNDLDLEVVAGGVLYKGNVFANGRSAAGGTADPRNNVENVFLPAGIKGAVSVRIVGKNIAGDGIPGNAAITDQDFALVVSNGERKAALGVLQFASSTVVPEGGGTVGPGDKLTIRARLKNAGNFAIPSFNTVLRAVATDATVTQASSNYGAIAPGATVASTSVFRAQVKANLACGKPVRLSLNGAAGGNPFSIPFQVQTGKPGNLVTIASADIPKNIPDASPTGVTSVLNVPTNGVVNDIRVTIGSILHPFMSDLSIDLTSPDGTTVRLFDRRGSSGDNMTNTVFADSATTPISAGVAPFTGSFQPEQPLSAFKGKLVVGTWKLTVRDGAAQDVGTLQSWGLTHRVLTCS